MRNFFGNRYVPHRIDFDKFQSARKTFYAHTNTVLLASVSSILIEEFTNLISKSFARSGESRRLFNDPLRTIDFLGNYVFKLTSEKLFRFLRFFGRFCFFKIYLSFGFTSSRIDTTSSNSKSGIGGISADAIDLRCCFVNSTLLSIKRLKLVFH